MSCANGKCDECGRFMAYRDGASSAAIYDFVAMECVTEIARCAKCTAELGPVHSNARPANGDMSPYETRTPN